MNRLTDGLLQEEKAHEQASLVEVLRAARSKIQRVMDPPPSLLWRSMGGVGISRARVGDSPSCGCVRAWGGVLYPTCATDPSYTWSHCPVLVGAHCLVQSRDPTVEAIQKG